MKSILIVISTAVVLTAASDTRIADAAQQGDRNAVRALLSQKVDVNAPQGDGSTALHWAAYRNDAEMAKMLLAAGASTKSTTRIGALTPLMLAAKNGNSEAVQALIAAGADANDADEHGTTVLMMASAAGNPDAVRTLIEHGADVNARDGAHGQTALMFAASLNRDEAIRVLLAHHADPKIQTKAVKLPKPGPRFDDPAPEKSEAKPPAPPASESAADQKTNLDALAVAAGFKSAIYSPEAGAGLAEMVRKLSAKVDAIEKRLSAPADAKDNASMFGIIRERGTLDMGGLTALLFAARDGSIDAVRALLEGGADINQVSASEKTSPLVMAIMNGHFDLAKLLIDWGADPNLSNAQGLTALYATVDVQWAPKGWFPSPITAQEKVTYLELMRALLDAGADPNARLGKKLWFRSFGDHSWIDTAGATAFWRAAQSTDLEAMHLLIDHGADPDIPSAHGDTALMVASGIGWGYHYSMNSIDSKGPRWMETVKYCMQLGADVNAADDRGYTPLHGAAYIGNNELINYLVEKGGDVKAVAKDKNTVADMANGPTRFGIPHPETVALLEKLGSANSHNCRSDQCLVNPKDEKKPATSNTTSTSGAAAPATSVPAKKPGER